MIIYVTTVEKAFHLPNEREYKTTTQWKFLWGDGMIMLPATGWKQPAKDAEEAYKRIKGYFYGSSYQIIDVKEGYN